MHCGNHSRRRFPIQLCRCSDETSVSIPNGFVFSVNVLGCLWRRLFFGLKKKKKNLRADSKTRNRVVLSFGAHPCSRPVATGGGPGGGKRSRFNVRALLNPRKKGTLRMDTCGPAGSGLPICRRQELSKRRQNSGESWKAALENLSSRLKICLPRLWVNRTSNSRFNVKAGLLEYRA